MVRLALFQLGFIVSNKCTMPFDVTFISFSENTAAAELLIQPKCRVESCGKQLILIE
jgi:hypothetical protein